MDKYREALRALVIDLHEAHDDAASAADDYRQRSMAAEAEADLFESKAVKLSDLAFDLEALMEEHDV